MNTRSSAAALCTAFLAALLAGCQGFQGYMPRDETPDIPAVIAPEVPRGPSSQRVGRDGYPLIGAYPRAATTQASPEAVSETQARYANVAARGARRGDYAGTVSDLGRTAVQAQARTARTAEYERSVEELQELARRQQARTEGR